MPDTDPPESSWVGWYRPSKRLPWERVCESSDRCQVLCELLDSRHHGEYIVTAGEDPNAQELLP